MPFLYIKDDNMVEIATVDLSKVSQRPVSCSKKYLTSIPFICLLTVYYEATPRLDGREGIQAQNSYIVKTAFRTSTVLHTFSLVIVEMKKLDSNVWMTPCYIVWLM